MILPDTSVWVEFLRRTETPADVKLTSMIGGGEQVAVTEPIFMELLAGARTADETADLGSRLGTFELIPVRGLEDYEAAASIYRVCRSSGATIRNLIDCLIAAVAIREDVPILHDDADYDVIARYTGLRILEV